MSDTTASYFCHDSQQKNEIVPPERSTTVKTNDNLKIHDLSITEDDQESSSSSSSINHIVSPITTTAFIKGRCTTQSFSSTTALISPHVLLPSFDVHTLYKLKTTRSSKKLDDFFGEYAPHDICIKEIQKEGLKAILQSKTPLCYFLYHLLQEYCSENLFFFIELEQYESFTYTSTSQQMTSAQHIFNTYLTKNSYFEVNLDEKDRRKIIQALGEKDVKNCFDSAKRAVYSLLESSYMQFQNTDIFQEMIQNCGMCVCVCI
ncbi:RGS domain-containing protein [Cokeromyces recurvatus]|uniref:RGS domain-containing protein n=1 Tax=Cokeromyces recurvatus TaxID=90255 RepID=UPI00221F60FF|nr:RGS domain-containing protein [Cokeromyces recurvatus]KAI7901855.1 RGS domain-containing protein [Cokeromyces recurvatus]